MNLTEPELELAGGTVVGEYEVEEVIGRGGFGTVYAALHPLIGKRVAIKVLARRYSADPAIVSRFVAEARAVNQIRHQHIVDIFSFGRLPDGRQYYVMEHLVGQPLDKHLREHGHLPIGEVVQILRPIARALDAAHATGVAHRDLKPENVFVGRDAEGAPFPKLLDFGLAKLLAPDAPGEHRTQSGMLLGTPHYMSPEQCRGRAVDHRTDCYSFGVMTYQLLTGELPFSGHDQLEILFKQVHDQPAPPSSRVELPAGVDEAVLAMLAKDPDARPTSITEAIAALATAAGIAPSSSGRLHATAPVVPRPTPVPAAPTKELRKGVVSTNDPTLPIDSATPAPAEPRSNISLPSGQLAPESKPRTRRAWVLGGVGAVAIAGILGAVTLRDRDAKTSDVGSGSSALDQRNVDGERPWALGVSQVDQQRALVLFREGNKLLNEQDLAKAASTYEAAVALWHHPAIQYNLSLARLGLGQDGEALAQLTAALTYPDALDPAMVANARATRQRLIDALRTHAASVDAAPSDVAPAVDFYERGQGLYNAKRYAEAIVMFDKGLELESDPKKQRVFIDNIAQAYREQGDCKTAIGVLRRHARREGEHANLATTLAGCVVRLHVVGAPDGTRVLDPSGTLLGTTPDLELTRGTNPMELRFEREGYQTADAKVFVPSGSDTIEFTLPAFTKVAPLGHVPK